MERRGFKTEKRTLPVRLTQEEMDQCAKDMAVLVKEEGAMEKKHKDITDALKEEKKGLKERIGSVAQKLRTEHENRLVNVDIVLNDAENSVESIRRDTGEVIDSRPQTHDERQMRFPEVAETSKDDDRDLPTCIHAAIRAKANGATWEHLGEWFNDAPVGMVGGSTWAMIHTGELDENTDEQGEAFLTAPNAELRYDILAMLLNQPAIGTEQGVPGGVDLILLKKTDVVDDVAKLSGDDLRTAYENETGKKAGSKREATLRKHLLAARSK